MFNILDLRFFEPEGSELENQSTQIAINCRDRLFYWTYKKGHEWLLKTPFGLTIYKHVTRLRPEFLDA